MARRWIGWSRSAMSSIWGIDPVTSIARRKLVAGTVEAGPSTAPGTKNVPDSAPNERETFSFRPYGAGDCFGNFPRTALRMS